MASSVPAVEVAAEKKSFGGRRPFAVPDPRLPIVSPSVESEVVVSKAGLAGELARKRTLHPPVMLIPPHQRRPVRLQPRVELDQAGAVGFGIGGLCMHRPSFSLTLFQIGQISPRSAAPCQSRR